MVFNQENLEPFFGGPERSVAIRAEGGDALKAVSDASHLLLEKLTACRELDIKFASANMPVDDSYPHSSKNASISAYILVHVLYNWFCKKINRTRTLSFYSVCWRASRRLRLLLGRASVQIFKHSFVRVVCRFWYA